MDIKSTFAGRLKELRGQMSQAEFGSRIGVSRGSISYYENGTRTADIEILDKICQTYGVSADWLLGLSNVRTKDIEIQAVAEKTGLHENLVEYLVEDKEFASAILNILFEDTARLTRLLHNINRYLLSEVRDTFFRLESRKNRHPNEPIFNQEVTDMIVYFDPTRVDRQYKTDHLLSRASKSFTEMVGCGVPLVMYSSASWAKVVEENDGEACPHFLRNIIDDKEERPKRVAARHEKEMQRVRARKENVATQNTDEETELIREIVQKSNEELYRTIYNLLNQQEGADDGKHTEG